VGLPLVLLTAGLLGGLRVEDGGLLLFLPPPLVTLLMASLLLGLFTRAHVLPVGQWLGGEAPLLERTSRFLTILALFFASAQAFGSVLPEQGLPRAVFAVFFLWTLWQQQFAPFDAARLFRSLAALFGTAFVLKHLVLAELRGPDSGWGRRLLSTLLEGTSLVAPGSAPGPANGYVSFLALAIYCGGIALMRPGGASSLPVDVGRAVDAPPAP
jgi:hypothetical protein